MDLNNGPGFEVSFDSENEVKEGPLKLVKKD